MSGSWQPDNVIPSVMPDGAPRVDWVGPAGAPFDFDIVVPSAWSGHTWRGVIRAQADTDVLVVFEVMEWGVPADGLVTGTATAITTSLDADECYLYGLAHDEGSGFDPVVGGTLRSTAPTVTPP